MRSHSGCDPTLPFQVGLRGTWLVVEQWFVVRLDQRNCPSKASGRRCTWRNVRRGTLLNLKKRHESALKKNEESFSTSGFCQKLLETQREENPRRFLTARKRPTPPAHKISFHPNQISLS
mmetsp:Transcript_27275/g.51149  ORF Transcript_27275/g.51149 Transcript_27275/m.51149 type:complete len:120 (+) Transcript_27275:193-552(+)